MHSSMIAFPKVSWFLLAARFELAAWKLVRQPTQQGFPMLFGFAKSSVKIV